MYNRWKPPEDELYHYGVMGMKWGVRKINRYEAKNAKALNDGSGITIRTKDGKAQAFDKKGVSYLYRANKSRADVDAKATKKLNKINAKHEKKQSKADRKFEKAERKANGLLASKRSAERAFRKASKSQFKANKTAARGKRWYEEMIKAYKKANIPMSESNRQIGEEFIKRVRSNSQAMYAATYVR